MTRSTYYVPELGVVLGARAGEDSVRWDLILRWGDQIAGSKFDGVTLVEDDAGGVRHLTTRTYPGEKPRTVAS